MNPAEIETLNTATALAAGWKLECQEAIQGNWRTKDQWAEAPDGTTQLCLSIPRYVEDLNACAQFENGLTDDEYNKYTDLLFDIQVRDRDVTGKWRWVSSTAVQRCEAFVELKGKKG